MASAPTAKNTSLSRYLDQECRDRRSSGPTTGGPETGLHSSAIKANASRTVANLASRVRAPDGVLVTFDQLPGRFENLICTEGLGQHGVRAQALREAKSVSGPEPPSSMADQDRLRGLCVAETERMMSLPPPLHGCRTDDASMARRSIASTFGSASTSAEGSRMKRFTLPEPKRM